MCQWVLVQYSEFIVQVMFQQNLHIKIRRKMRIMENEKNYKYIIVVIISILLFFSTAFFLGTSLSANRRYRTELERNARLESTIREQESAIRESSECIRLTRDELGDIIQS